MGDLERNLRNVKFATMNLRNKATSMRGNNRFESDLCEFVRQMVDLAEENLKLHESIIAALK